jgi:hypothetical protein
VYEFLIKLEKFKEGVLDKACPIEYNKKVLSMGS